jgi:hypothetical protein
MTGQPTRPSHQEPATVDRLSSIAFNKALEKLRKLAIVEGCEDAALRVSELGLACNAVVLRYAAIPITDTDAVPDTQPVTPVELVREDTDWNEAGNPMPGLWDEVRKTVG